MSSLQQFGPTVARRCLQRLPNRRSTGICQHRLKEIDGKVGPEADIMGIFAETRKSNLSKRYNDNWTSRMDTCHRLSYFDRLAAFGVTSLVVILIGLSDAFAAQADGKRTVDFGVVGVDFLVYHSFRYVNTSPQTVLLKTKNVPCECSKVKIADTLLAPGDSTDIRLEFDTKNVFGPTVKSFTLSTTDPAFPTLEYYYMSNVGQWLLGIKPNPPSVFFLPAHSSKRVTIANPRANSLGITLIDQADSNFTVKMIKGKVAKGESGELEIVVAPNLPKGTYYSSFRIRMEPSEGANPFLLTIPVKIVRY